MAVESVVQSHKNIELIIKVSAGLLGVLAVAFGWWLKFVLEKAKQIYEQTKKNADSNQRLVEESELRLTQITEHTNDASEALRNVKEEVSIVRETQNEVRESKEKINELFDEAKSVLHLANVGYNRLRALSSNADEQFRGVTALVQNGGFEVIPTLVEVVSNGKRSVRVRVEALAGIENFLSSYPSEAKTVLGAIKSAINDKSPAVNRAAIQAIRTVNGNITEFEPLLRSAISKKDKNVAQMAEQLLAEFNSASLS